MDGHNGRYLRCNPKPSRPALEQDLQLLRGQLRYYLKTNPRQLTPDVNAARQVSRHLKDIFGKFTESSRALTSLILSEGGSDEAVPLRQERIELREEVEEVIEHMNIILRELGELEVSKIPSPDLTIRTVGQRAGVEDSSAHDILDDSISSNILGQEPPGLATTIDRHRTSSPIFQEAPIFMSPYAQPFEPAFNPSCTAGPSIIETPIRPPLQMLACAPTEAPQAFVPTFPRHTVGNNHLTPHYTCTKLNEQTRQPRPQTALCYTAPRMSTHLAATSAPQNSVRDMALHTTVYGERHSHFNTCTALPHVTATSSVPYSQQLQNNGQIGQAATSHPAPQPVTVYGGIENTVDTITRCFAQQEVMKQPVPTFDGTCHLYRNWKSQILDHLATFTMRPSQNLRMILGFTTSHPKSMIESFASTVSEVTQETLNTIWAELDVRYGSTESIALEVKKKIENFPDLRGSDDLATQLYSLIDLCTVAHSYISKCQELENLNLSSGLRDLREKLPTFMQRKWAKIGQDYYDAHNNRHPPFGFFIQFLRDQAKTASTDNFAVIDKKTTSTSSAKKNHTVKVLHTAASVENKASTSAADRTNGDKLYCYFHKCTNHETAKCNGFAKSTDKVKQEIMSKNGLCFGCLEKHRIKDCKAAVACSKCGKPHLDILHRSGPYKQKDISRTEDDSSLSTPPTSTASKVCETSKQESPSVKCTWLCGNRSISRNCSRTFLVDISLDDVKNKVLRSYVIVDDQSNCTLVDEELIQFFGKPCPTQHYTMTFVQQSTRLPVDGQIIFNLRVNGV